MTGSWSCRRRSGRATCHAKFTPAESEISLKGSLTAMSNLPSLMKCPAPPLSKRTLNIFERDFSGELFKGTRRYM